MTVNKPSLETNSSTIPRWVNTLLVVFIGYALAVVSVKLIAATSIAVPQIIPRNFGVVAGPSSDRLALGKQIASRHLFGDATAKPQAEPQAVVKAPVVETSLNLKLAGVFAYEPQSRAIAIISNGGNEEAAYRVGEKILGQTTLKAVYPDRVILNNNGRDEVLRLPENVTPIASSRPIVRENVVANNDNGLAQSEEALDLPTTPGALRDTLARNPSLLGRVVAAEPYQENGKLIGYRILPKQNPEILEAQGILAGDIITRVNNIELNSQKQGIRALRNAVKAQALEVTILRDGVEVPVTISLAE